MIQPGMTMRLMLAGLVVTWAPAWCDCAQQIQAGPVADRGLGGAVDQAGASSCGMPGMMHCNCCARARPGPHHAAQTRHRPCDLARQGATCSYADTRSAAPQIHAFGAGFGPAVLSPLNMVLSQWFAANGGHPYLQSDRLVDFSLLGQFCLLLI